MIYGHPAPCLVTRLRRGAVLVEPLRFIPLSEIGQPSGRLEGRAPDLNHGAQPGGAPFPALPGEQMRAASTPRSRDGVPLFASSLQKFRVLVACEYSAVVRDAFRARDFDAWSCDLLPTEGDPRWHIQGDALEAVYGQPWDLLIAHPPCTDLAVSGARHFAAKIADGRQARALEFVQSLLDAPVPHIALENPVSVISSKIRKPDFTIQPWQFGHGEVKRTCFWTTNLPPLRPTNIVDGREARVHKMRPGPDRWKERSRTLPGVAAAMAVQWGDYIVSNSIHIGLNTA